MGRPLSSNVQHIPRFTSWPPWMRPVGSLPAVLRIGNDERVGNFAAVEFVSGIRRRGGRAWLHREQGGGYTQRAAGSLLNASATALSFAVGQGNGMPQG